MKEQCLGSGLVENYCFHNLAYFAKSPYVSRSHRSYRDNKMQTPLSTCIYSYIVHEQAPKDSKMSLVLLQGNVKDFYSTREGFYKCMNNKNTSTEILQTMKEMYGYQTGCW